MEDWVSFHEQAGGTFSYKKNNDNKDRDTRDKWHVGAANRPF